MSEQDLTNYAMYPADIGRMIEEKEKEKENKIQDNQEVEDMAMYPTGIEMKGKK